MPDSSEEWEESRYVEKAEFWKYIVWFLGGGILSLVALGFTTGILYAQIQGNTEGYAALRQSIAEVQRQVTQNSTWSDRQIKQFDEMARDIFALQLKAVEDIRAGRMKTPDEQYSQFKKWLYEGLMYYQLIRPSSRWQEDKDAEGDKSN